MSPEDQILSRLRFCLFIGAQIGDDAHHQGREKQGSRKNVH